MLEASVPLAFLFGDVGLEPQLQRLEAIARHGEAWVPGTWSADVVSGVLAAIERGRCGQEEAMPALAAFSRLLVSVDRDGPQATRLLELAREHGLGASAAGYLELALRRGVGLATLDPALREATRRAGVPLME